MISRYVMKYCIKTITFLFAITCHADDLVITSFSQNGVVTWTYPTNEVSEYRIEWASSLVLEEWTDLRCGIQGLAPTGGTMTANVPMFYRVLSFSVMPTNMVYIPAGRFDMGDSFSEGNPREQPVHSVYLSGYWIDQYEVSSQLWYDVYSWSLTNGYIFSNTGSGKTNNHPVNSVNWYDAVKWCNARSEREGLTPCYYIDSSLSNAYRKWETDIQNDWVDWTANGYRLPTEAEWEKAARGGSARQRFPWGSSSISHGRANYFASTNYSYDQSSGGYHPNFSTGSPPYTSPIGNFSPNSYGLYDCAGNVWEWCWDWYSDSYYANSPNINPRGPGGPLLERVKRGGSWDFVANLSRVAFRDYNYPDSDSYGDVGFRCARGL